MPFAPKIRKDILQALEKTILPTLETEKVLQVRADPLRGFAHLQHWVERQEFLPHQEYKPLQKVATWPDQFMMSFSKPTFNFIFQGTIHERIGVTENDYLQAQEHKIQHALAGIIKFRLEAPALVFYPAFVLHSNGYVPVQPFYEAKELSVKLIDELVQVSIIDVGPPLGASHNLAIRDKTLVQLGSIYQQELCEANNELVSQAILTAFMGRLQKYLQKNQPVISNSCWENPAPKSNQRNETSSQKKIQLFHEASNYIQTHLNEPLTVKKIAEHCQVSPSHLNHVFRQAQGTSLMRYVTHLRIKTAQTILSQNPERVSDVARLVGFASTSSFCTVFQKHVKLSPSEFRYQERLKRGES